MLSLKSISILHLRLFKRLKILHCLAFLAILLPYVTAGWDPYDIIGVRRDASTEEIKRAYRDLARKLHPDKSNLNEEEAGRKFIELNKAFNILKDPEKRSRYDQYGEIEDNRRPRNHRAWHHQHNRRDRESWNQQGYRTFTFYTNMDSSLRRSSITSWQFHNEYVKASATKPFFIFFYADFCQSCSMIEGAWAKIVSELAKFNIGSFTINVQQESRLSQGLDINSIPHIACLIDGQIKPYLQPELSLSKIVKFTKSLLPSDLVTTLYTEKDQDSFIALCPSKNRLCAIILHNESSLKLRFLMLAYGLRQYYIFGDVSTKLCQYSQLSKQYNLTVKTDSQMAHLLVFNENFERPLISEHLELDGQEFTKIHSKMMKWPFLKLPKIFSQSRFDDLCIHSIPRDGEKTKSRLCIVLFTQETSIGLAARRKLIEFISQNHLEQDEKTVFAYIDPSKQSHFVETLLEATHTESPIRERSPDLFIILLERHRLYDRKAYYKWLRSCWNPGNQTELNGARMELYDHIRSYKSGIALQSKVELGVLTDEEGPSILGRVLTRMMHYLMKSVDYITSRESTLTMMLLMVGALIACIFLQQVPSYSPPRGSPTWNAEDRKNQHRGAAREEVSRDDDLRIMELKAETYNGMVRLLKPGYRSIILLLDRDTKESLLAPFKAAVWPYRRNKTLTFGYLCLDKNLTWYRQLLQQVLGVSDLTVNKKNCIGTVLSLNGFKKYFRVYHAKHHETDCYDEENSGSFLGFDDDNEDDLEGGVTNLRQNGTNSGGRDGPCSVDDLLKRLPIWLDKMFDGLTKRYFIEQWPEDIN